MNLVKTIRKPFVNYQQRLKNYLILYFNYPPDIYMHQIYSDWDKFVVRKTSEVLINGILIFAAFFWVWILYVSSFRVLDIIMLIFSLGFFSMFVRQTYRFFRADWRQKK